MRPSHRSHIRRHHPVRRAIAVIAAIVVVAWCVFASRFLWFPHVDKQPAHVDAIVQLGGPHGGVDTYETTRNLAHNYTTNLVISDPYTEKPDLGARMIIGRCYNGDLNVGYHKTPLSWKDTIWEWAYQTGGVAKVLVQRGC